MEEKARERASAILDTLRFLAAGWIANSEDQKWLRDVIADLECGNEASLSEWVCCPLCAEVLCDDHCPFAPLRDSAS